MVGRRMEGVRESGLEEFPTRYKINRNTGHRFVGRVLDNVLSVRENFKNK